MLQKLPSAGGKCISVNMLTFHLSFHPIAFKSPCFSVSFLPESLGISFQFGLTVLQKFMAFVYKLLFRRREILSM
jgi:hypothetical protein